MQGNTTPVPLHPLFCECPVVVFSNRALFLTGRTQRQGRFFTQNCNGCTVGGICPKANGSRDEKGGSDTRDQQNQTQSTGDRRCRFVGCLAIFTRQKGTNQQYQQFALAAGGPQGGKVVRFLPRAAPPLCPAAQQQKRTGCCRFFFNCNTMLWAGLSPAGPRCAR